MAEKYHSSLGLLSTEHAAGQAPFQRKRWLQTVDPCALTSIAWKNTSPMKLFHTWYDGSK